MYLTDILKNELNSKTIFNCTAILCYRDIPSCLWWPITGNYPIIVIILYSIYNEFGVKYANNNFNTYKLLCKFLLQVSQPTACHAIHRVTHALTRRINDFVKFPNENNSGRIKDGFYEKIHFSGVIGCLDGTHVGLLITAPHNYEVDYVNRKGYTPINVQVICDHLGKWINIVARWRGSTHESRIFKKQSNIEYHGKWKYHRVAGFS